MDISSEDSLSKEIVKRVETSRFGPVTYQIGVDQREAAMSLRRVAIVKSIVNGAKMAAGYRWIGEILPHGLVH
ncbi:MAG TPA: hypothetical protein DCS11_03020 [Syntrophus sp. (in: bacteria)]|nr:hypothetical protein [Syntrophus sp. (in: bacteria)]